MPRPYRKSEICHSPPEYINKSLKQILLGNWTDEAALMEILGRIGWSLLDLDLPMDMTKGYCQT